MKFNTKVLIFCLALVFILSGCAKKPPSSSEIKKEGEELNKKVEQLNSGIKVPDSLLKCPDKYFTDVSIQCENLPEEAFCTYTKHINDGKEVIDNGQHVNECSLCRWYGKDGYIKSGGITLIGYEKGECYQGMYKK